MAFLAPQVTFPTEARRSVRRRQTRTLMSAFGLVPVMPAPAPGDPLYRWRSPEPFQRPRPVPLPPVRTGTPSSGFANPANCVNGVYVGPYLDSLNWTPPNCPPVQAPGAPTVQANAGTPVPAGFPTNQIFVAPDGSQWIYSTPHGTWISTGTPFNVGVTPGVPVTPAPSASTAPTTPVSVSVTPAPTAVPAASPYQSILDFLTQSSLIPGAPNWAVGLGAFLAFKLIEGKMSSSSGRRNPRRYRRQR